jgi:hypothetical protein
MKESSIAVEREREDKQGQEKTTKIKERVTITGTVIES